MEIQKPAIRILLSITVVLLAAIALQAQEGTITGRVIDGDGRPVWGARLRISVTNKTTMTDRQGQFQFGPVGNGRYHITVVFAAGYYEDENVRDQTDGYRSGEIVTIRLRNYLETLNSNYQLRLRKMVIW